MAKFRTCILFPWKKQQQWFLLHRFTSSQARASAYAGTQRKWYCKVKTWNPYKSWFERFTAETDNDELCWIVDRDAVNQDDGCLDGVKFMSLESELYYKMDLDSKVQIIEVPFQGDRLE